MLTYFHFLPSWLTYLVHVKKKQSHTWRNFFNNIIFQISPLSIPLPLCAGIPDTWAAWQPFWIHNTTHLHARSSVKHATTTQQHSCSCTCTLHTVHLYPYMKPLVSPLCSQCTALLAVLIFANHALGRVSLARSQVRLQMLSAYKETLNCGTRVGSI